MKILQEHWEFATAPRFNLFRVLRIQRKEVKLHSRFIAELLKPSGDHSQKTYFLKSFFEIAAKGGLRPPSVEKIDHAEDWQIKTEEPTDFGQLDIVLRSEQLQFITVIENKVDAGEQDNQLERYANWLTTQEEKFPNQNLVFLTPKGRMPGSIDLAGRSKCVCLSYRKHIGEWLKQTLNSLQASSLRFAIEQYLQIVEDL